MVEVFCKAAGQGVPLAVVVSDSTSTAKIGQFAKQFPDKLVNVGIAEQGLVGVAAGLSLGGLVPFTCNAAPFLIGRANEQVKNDVCYSGTNVKLVGLNAGVCYGPLGSTHHSIDDISTMRGFGTIEIYAPADPLEAQAIFEYAIAHTGPVYIRLDSAAFPQLHGPEYRFTPGAVERLREGRDVTLCAMGSVVHEAVTAADLLRDEGIDAAVLSVPSIRPIDRTSLASLAGAAGRLVTVEEHSLAGGLGSLVCETLIESGTMVRVKRLGVPEGEWPKAGPRQQMRSHYGLDAAGIAAAARALCRE
jgi:transketolase